MATINLNSIQDFFENGLNYCSSKLKEITPIIPYTYINLKQIIFSLQKTDELASLRKKSKLKYLKNIPDYALVDFDIDFEELTQINEHGNISDGIYYIVLADLVGSTKYLINYGNEKAAKRIINFVQASLEAFIKCEKVNKAYFLKEVGDSVLFIFTHVSDVVKWHHEFNTALSKRNEDCDECYQIRTCVHLGEVCLHDANPICLSVSETFKMEKQVDGGKIVFSALAAQVALPSLNGSEHQLEPYQHNVFGCNMHELVAVKDFQKAPS